MNKIDSKSKKYIQLTLGTLRRYGKADWDIPLL